MAGLMDHVEEDSQFDDAAYAVAGMPGVAWHVLGWETEPDEDTECGYENRTGRLACVMVGDDRKFALDPDDVRSIPDDAFCHVCGQIGCTHDGR